MTTGSNKISRRRFLKGTATAATGVLIAGCTPATPTTAPAPKQAPTTAPAPQQAPATIKPAGFNWKRFAGTTLDLLMIDQVIWQAQKERLPEFEALTGIKVNWNLLPGAVQYSKTLLQLTTDPAKAEVFLMVPPMQGYQYAKEGFMEDLNPFIKNPELTSPDWDAADWLPGPMRAMQFKGIQGGLPLYTHTELLWYRPSLYQKKGLKVPETFEELEANAKALHDPGNQMYGFSMRGIGAAAMWQWAQWLYGYGGSWVTPNLEPNFAGQPGIDAATIYGRMMRTLSAPGPTELDDAKNQVLWKSGNLAQYLQAPHYAVANVDPAQSKIIGDQACALYPAGPKGRFPLSVGVGFSMSFKSPHKEAVWYYMQWATSKEMVAHYQIKLGQATCRKSAWEHPDYTASAVAKLPGFVDTIFKQTASAQTSDPLPPAEDVAAARDIIGVALNTAIQGGDIPKALKTSADQYAKLLSGVPKEQLLPPTPTKAP